MHVFYEFLIERLIDGLKKRRVVVWYDSRSEFRSFIHELANETDPNGGEVLEIQAEGLKIQLCVYNGSFFECFPSGKVGQFKEWWIQLSSATSDYLIRLFS